MANTDASAANILSDRGLRYKRNILAASLIVTALYWTGAQLGTANLFGVMLPDGKDREATAWVILLVILAYQWLMLSYYGWTDWLTWQQQIKKEFQLSPFSVAIKLRRGAAIYENGARGNLSVDRINVTPHVYGWSEQTTRSGISGYLYRSARENARWRLIIFATFEFGLPYLWSLFSLYIAACMAFGINEPYPTPATPPS